MSDSINNSIVSSNIAAPRITRLFSVEGQEMQKSERLRLSLSRFIHLFPCYKLNDTVSRIFLEPETRNSQNFSRGAVSDKIMSILSPNSSSLQVPRATVIRVLGHGASGPVMYAETARPHGLSLSQPLDLNPVQSTEELPSTDPNTVIELTHVSRYMKKRGFAVKFIDIENNESPHTCLDHAEREVKALSECNFFSILKMYTVLKVERRVKPTGESSLPGSPEVSDGSIVFDNVRVSSFKSEAKNVEQAPKSSQPARNSSSAASKANVEELKLSSIFQSIESLSDSVSKEAPLSGMKKLPKPTADFSSTSSSSMSSANSALNNKGENLSNVLGITMEFEHANTGDLRSEIKNRLKSKFYFSERDVALTMVQVVMAVYYLHEVKGIIHRDIKTSNILVCSNGLIKLADFGYCKEVDSVEDDLEHSLCGTPYYMAPEVWRKVKYNKKIDIFSLGVVFYELLTLDRPFVGDNIQTIKKNTITNKYTPIERNGRYSTELIELVETMMDPDPEKRPSTIDILCDPSLRRSMATLLDVVYSEPAMSATSAMQTPREMHLGKSPAALPPRTSRRTLNINSEEKISILNDIYSVYKPVVDHLISRMPVDDLTVEPLKLKLTGDSTPIKRTGAGTPLGSRNPKSVKVILESTVMKANKDNEWKNRYLQIVQYPTAAPNESAFKLRQGLKKIKVLKGEHIELNFNTIVDCQELEPSELPQNTFGIGLLETSGKQQKIAFPTESIMKEWITTCLQVVCLNPLMTLPCAALGESGVSDPSPSRTRNSGLLDGTTRHLRVSSYDFVPSPPTNFNSSFSSGLDKVSPTTLHPERVSPLAGFYQAPQVFAAPTPPRSLTPSNSNCTPNLTPTNRMSSATPLPSLGSHQVSGASEDYDNR